MKAVKITKNNKNMLATRFNIEDDDKEELLPDGYFLVTDFGNDDTYDVITQNVLAAEFHQTGTSLDNGFFEVEKL